MVALAREKWLEDGWILMMMAGTRKLGGGKVEEWKWKSGRVGKDSGRSKYSVQCKAQTGSVNLQRGEHTHT